jgi:putative membrane protein
MEQNPERHKKLIVALSVIIPVAVAILFKIRIPGYDFSFLPPIYATINGITALLLITAVVAVRRGQKVLHEVIMKSCILLSGLFLVMYILYHMTSDPTPYGGTGYWRTVYFVILVSHIILSVAVIPMVLFTFVRALSGNFERHKALARFTFPVWLYVAVTGVLVYWMISPYYS